MRTCNNGGNQAEALDAVNTLRLRANAEPFTSIDLDKVLDEKAREFFFEGQRRTDLIRYGYFTGSTYMYDWKGGAINGQTVPSRANLYPIPTSDIIANGTLTQNPGY